MVNLAIASSSIMPKKKVPVEVLHGPIGGFFSQKKRVSVGNIKHSKDEKDIFLAKSDPSYGVYLDMDSVSGNSKDDNIPLDAGDGSFFDLVINTPKARKATSNLVCGSPLGSIDYKIDEDNVEVSVRKFFVLDINLSAVKGKSVTAKTQYIRKIFSSVNGFGGTITLLKFEGII
ncbi:hypothetical protein G9A89_019328 [Geosiphon pyriformis]|nr:hypothetical protein G9A89_019328 [Geosiphon pyriformis]